MSKIWFTADLHFGETRLKLMRRPFKTTEEQNETLIKNFNEVIATDDILIVNGDVAVNPESLPLVNRLNGRKTLVRGNYDRQFTDEVLSEYFEKIIPEGWGLPLEIDAGKSKIPIWVTHYPTKGRTDRFNITGHIHKGWTIQLNSLNVGVDVHDYRPIPADDIDFFLRAACDYYDEDMWAAYAECNAFFRGKRGKQGSYLDNMPPTEKPKE